MKDFFDRQENARRKTSRLIILFVIAVILIIVCVYMAVSGVYYLTLVFSLEKSASLKPFIFFDAPRIIIVSLITLAVIFGGSLFKISELKGGGHSVAEMLGGRPVLRNTQNLEEQRLLNVVEEMAIASGIPVPDVYILDREGGINAFTAGYGFDDAVICVTKGTAVLLNRDELQAVVAHEFSHLLNSDTTINIRMMGWLHGILMISLIGEGFLRAIRYTRGRISIPAVILGGALYVLGSIGLFFGNLIKSAVSRQREFLADASSVQFTRNPSGLAGALKKIGGLTFGSHLIHPRVSEASHMYFSNGLDGAFLSMMQTHPPLLERIRAIEPYFDGDYPEVKALPVIKPVVRPVKRTAKKILETAPIVSGAMAMAILETVGAPMKEHEKMARYMLDALPEPVRLASREPVGACALVYILLLDKEQTIREKQIALLKEFASADIIAEADTIAAYMPSLSPRLRLPLLDLSIPALRSLSVQQYESFRKNIDRLVTADHKLSLFECVLSHIVIRRLDAYFYKKKKMMSQIYGIRGVARECSVVLSLLARIGQRGEDAAGAAFKQGKKILREPKIDFEFIPAEECTLKEFDRALEKLATCSPLITRKLLAACLECLTFDKTITVQEAELFRAIGESLGCPIPPWLIFQNET